MFREFIAKYNYLFLKIIIIIFIIPTTSNCFAQVINIGHPYIKNFTKNDHHAGIQNWDIKQSANGTMLFSNNGGLLTFDGVEWKIVEGKTFINRKILVDSIDNTIYIGGQNVFGYYETMSNGSLNFIDLSQNLLPEDQQFGDIWQVVKHKSTIYFKSSRRLFAYKNNEIDVFRTDTYFSYIGNINNKLLVSISQKGFFELINKKLKLINKNPAFIDEHVIDLLIASDGINIMFTEKNGLFHYTDTLITPWLTSNDKFIKENRITNAILLPDNRIAIGTQFGGILIVNNKGEIVEHFSTKTGLSSDYNRCLYLDKDNNLWAGQEKGIDFIAINEPFRWINQQENLMGIGYTVKFFQDYLYFGTSTGLYYINLKQDNNPIAQQNLKKVENSGGQVWNLDFVGDELFMSHHEGVFRVKKNKAHKIIKSVNGAWTFTKIDQDHYISGNYRGLALYTKSSGQWDLDHQYEDFDFTMRNIVYFDNHLWLNKANEGISRVKLSDDFQSIIEIEKMDKTYGLTDGEQNNTTIINSELFCLTQNGLYKYDQLSKQFSQDERWNNHFKNSNIKLLNPKHQNSVFYLDDHSFGYVSNFKKVTEKIITRSIEGPKDWFVGGFEHIYSLEDQAFIATEGGFINYQFKNPTIDSLNLTFSQITFCSQIDSCKLLSLSNDQQFTKISNLKSINFSFKTPHFIPYNAIMYKHRLKGYMDGWSEWTSTNRKEFNGLPAGNYTFEVISKTEGSLNSNNQSIQSNKISFTFEILPKWYASKLAQLFYFLFFCLLIAILILFPKKKYEKEKEALATEHEKIVEEHKGVIIEHKEVIEEHKEVIEQTEQELQAIKHAKLQDELSFKNKELMSTTMHLSQKNEIIENLKEELETLSKKTTVGETTKTVKKLVRVIKRHNNSDHDWDQFTRHFDQVHKGFFEKLQNDHTELTPRDIRLSAYLSLNLSTKEIGPLLGISVRGVESSRYRLRKKLNINKDENLVNYLMKYQ